MFQTANLTMATADAEKKFLQGLKNSNKKGSQEKKVSYAIAGTSSKKHQFKGKGKKKPARPNTISKNKDKTTLFFKYMYFLEGNLEGINWNKTLTTCQGDVQVGRKAGPLVPNEACLLRMLQGEETWSADVFLFNQIKSHFSQRTSPLISSLWRPCQVAIQRQNGTKGKIAYIQRMFLAAYSAAWSDNEQNMPNHGPYQVTSLDYHDEDAYLRVYNALIQEGCTDLVKAFKIKKISQENGLMAKECNTLQVQNEKLLLQKELLEHKVIASTAQKNLAESIAKDSEKILKSHQNKIEELEKENLFLKNKVKAHEAKEAKLEKTIKNMENNKKGKKKEKPKISTKTISTEATSTKENGQRKKIKPLTFKTSQKMKKNPNNGEEELLNLEPEDQEPGFDGRIELLDGEDEGEGNLIIDTKGNHFEIMEDQN